MSALRSPALSGQEPEVKEEKGKEKETRKISISESSPLVPAKQPDYATMHVRKMAEKESSFSEEESEEETILSQFGRLHKHLEAAKERKVDVWDLVDLINGFTTANGFKLSKEDEEILLDDMTAAADLLDAAEEFHDAKDEKGNVAADVKFKLEKALEDVLERAGADHTTKYESARDIGIKIGIGLTVLALGVAVGLVATATAPLVAAALLVGAVITLTASMIALYRQSNCTFFGQTQKNQMMLADLVATQSSALDEKKAGCFGG